jgi:hypothetical protein
MMNISVSNKTNSWKNKVSGSCYFGNSLFSSSHDGEKLELIVEWLNNSTDFQNIIVGLSDTLNRFTISAEDNLSPKEAHKKTIHLGDRWIARNQKILKKPFKFLRWDEWKLNDNGEIDLYKDFFLNLYVSDDLFRNYLHQDINNFFKRRYNKTILQMPSENFENSLIYIIEELATYSYIFKKIGPATRIYPANDLKVLKAIRNNVVQGIPNSIDDSFFVKLHVRDISQNSAA